MVTEPSSSRRRWRRLVDPYIVALFGTVATAAVLPATGRTAGQVDGASDVAIGLLFFLYGARLSPRQAVAGLRDWRLHLVIGASTFVFFPLLGLAGRGFLPGVLSTDLYTGVLFACLVPSTVQSAVALTAVARGNVPAAICAGTYSSLLGMVATPLLAAWLIGPHVEFSADGLLHIGGQLLAPFLTGQALRRWIGGFVSRHKKALGLVDRGSILLVVYSAFSKGMAEDIWSQVSAPRLLALLGVLAVLLATALAVTSAVADRLGFGRESRIAIVLCGSQKSLASGLPMAAVLFGAQASLTILPLMLFHQMQLMTGAVLAKRWSTRTTGRQVSGPPGHTTEQPVVLAQQRKGDEGRTPLASTAAPPRPVQPSPHTADAEPVAPPGKLAPAPRHPGAEPAPPQPAPASGSIPGDRPPLPEDTEIHHR